MLLPCATQKHLNTPENKPFRRLFTKKAGKTASLF